MNSLFLSLSAAAVGNCCHHVGLKSPDVQGLPVLVSGLYYAHCRNALTPLGIHFLVRK